jgi:hypothetical protein
MTVKSPIFSFPVARFSNSSGATMMMAALVISLSASSPSALGATLQVTYGFNATGSAEERLAPTSVLADGTTTTGLTVSSIIPSGFQSPIISNGPADGPTSPERFILSSTQGSAGTDGGHLSVFFPNTTELNNSEAEAAALGYYFDIILSPAAGYSLDLTTLNLDYTAQNNTDGRNFFVRYSHSATSNNFSSPNIMGAQFTDGGGQWVTGAGSSGNLDGIPVVEEGQSVTLRIYGYRTSVQTTAQNLRYDNIVITGQLNQIPEPAAGLLLVAAGMVGVGRRSRR